MSGPTAAPARFPYFEHRTLAEIAADSARGPSLAIVRSEPHKAPLNDAGDECADGLAFVHDGEGL